MKLHRKLRYRGMENKRFFFHPKPLKDELLSSWLVRISLMHRIAPVTFMNIHFPSLKPDIWSRDVDLFWGTKPSLLELLAYKSRVSIKDLYNTTLNSYEGYLNEKMHTNTRNKLITPIVNRGRENRARGLRYCPLCLKDDIVPFFRKEWRLSFVTVCLRHRCFLQDCCPRCKKPVSIYKLVRGDNLSNCYKCNTSYMNGKIVKVPQDSHGIEAQKNLLKILNSGLFVLEDRTYYSIFYFDAFKQMNKIIYNFNLRENIQEYESCHKIYPLPTFANKPSAYVEDIPLKEQYIVYSMSEYVLQSSEKANTFCKKNRVGKTELTHSMEYIPYWYDLIVLQNDHSQYSISLSEAKAALIYLKKYGSSISFRALSKLTGETLEKRKRPDIATYITYLVN